jgi:hypothetical protein
VQELASVVELDRAEMLLNVGMIDANFSLMHQVLLHYILELALVVQEVLHKQ